MDVSQILSYAMSIIQQLGLNNYISAGIIFLVAVSGLGALISLIRKN